MSWQIMWISCGWSNHNCICFVGGYLLKYSPHDAERAKHMTHDNTPCNGHSINCCSFNWGVGHIWFKLVIWTWCNLDVDITFFVSDFELTIDAHIKSMFFFRYKKSATKFSIPAIWLAESQTFLSIQNFHIEPVFIEVCDFPSHFRNLYDCYSILYQQLNMTIDCLQNFDKAMKLALSSRNNE